MSWCLLLSRMVEQENGRFAAASPSAPCRCWHARCTGRSRCTLVGGRECRLEFFTLEATMRVALLVFVSTLSGSTLAFSQDDWPRIAEIAVLRGIVDPTHIA